MMYVNDPFRNDKKLVYEFSQNDQYAYLYVGEDLKEEFGNLNGKEYLEKWKMKEELEAKINREIPLKEKNATNKKKL